MNEKLYHKVPLVMKGDTLMALSALKKDYPDLHDEAESKYFNKEESREDIINEKITPLDCARRDVINLTAIHPLVLKKALKDCGRAEPYEAEYYEIDPYALDPNKAIIDHHEKGIYEKFDPDKVGQYSEMPAKTLEYYKEEFNKGKHPFLHHGIPHILYKGEIDVSKAQKI